MARSPTVNVSISKKILFVLLILGGVLVISVFVSFLPSEYERGEQLLTEGKLSAALDELKSINSEDEDYASAQILIWNIAVQFYRNHQIDSVFRVLASIGADTRIFPESQKLMLLIAHENAATRNWPTALRAIGLVQSKDSVSFVPAWDLKNRILHQAGLENYAKNDWGGAIQLWSKIDKNHQLRILADPLIDKATRNYLVMHVSGSWKQVFKLGTIVQKIYLDVFHDEAYRPTIFYRTWETTGGIYGSQGMGPHQEEGKWSIRDPKEGLIALVVTSSPDPYSVGEVRLIQYSSVDMKLYKYGSSDSYARY